MFYQFNSIVFLPAKYLYKKNQVYLTIKKCQSYSNAHGQIIIHVRHSYVLDTCINNMYPLILQSN